MSKPQHVDAAEQRAAVETRSFIERLRSHASSSLAMWRLPTCSASSTVQRVRFEQFGRRGEADVSITRLRGVLDQTSLRQALRTNRLWLSECGTAAQVIDCRQLVTALTPREAAEIDLAHDVPIALIVSGRKALLRATEWAMRMGERGVIRVPFEDASEAASWAAKSAWRRKHGPQWVEVEFVSPRSAA